MRKLLSFLISMVSLLILLVVVLMFVIVRDPFLEFKKSIQLNDHQLQNPTDGPNSTQLTADSDQFNLIENGIHMATGLRDDPNLSLIIGACTSCHSAQLITQNRATRDGWQQMIEWMQATQGLPDLGDIEPIIIDYLAKHYAPQNVGRRPNLDVAAIEWYILSVE